MKPILPREMLWTEKKTMDEFFELAPENRTFYIAIITSDFPSSFTNDPVRIFNEVYYLMTRIIYEQPQPSELDRYYIEAKNQFKWRCGADVVMTLVYCLLNLTRKHVDSHYKDFVQAINESFCGCVSWIDITSHLYLIKQDGRRFNYSFFPRPMGLGWFEGTFISWSDITRNFDIECIEQVISLWEYPEEKMEIAMMMRDSLDFRIFSRKSASEHNEVLRILNKYILVDDKANGAQKKVKQSRNQFHEFVKDAARTDEIIAKLHCLIGNKRNTEAIKVINKAMWIDWISLPTAPSIKEEFDRITCADTYINRILDPNKPQKNSKDGLIVDEELLEKIREEFEQA